MARDPNFMISDSMRLRTVAIGYRLVRNRCHRLFE